MGHTNATKHKIVLKDLDIPPFKEHFCRIPPPQLDEVREHLKLMLDTGVVRPSNSPWCNAVVLVRKKDGSLRFCIYFQRLNALTVKDSHPLPCICETLESLAGVAHYSTFDLNLGFWQVPMDKESKQYTAFTLGSMGLYECESMPFRLCNAPPTFQRLMQNCLGELNLTYCLIYLDDVIVFSEMPEEHLQRMCVVFDCLREHGQGVSQEETIVARPARLATTNVTDWKQEQKEDPVLYLVAKHLRAPRETFKAALHKVLDKKATAAYVKAKEQLLIKNGLLYRKTWQGQADEIVFQFVVPQRHWGTTLDGCH